MMTLRVMIFPSMVLYLFTAGFTVAYGYLEIRQRVKVVGIGGVTRGGKSTLAAALARSREEVYPSVVSCDRHWKVSHIIIYTRFITSPIRL